MSSTAEAEVKPDGSTTFDQQPPPVTADEPSSDDGSGAAGGDGGADNSTFYTMDDDESGGVGDDVEKGTDPAIYLGVAVLVVAVLFIVYTIYKKRKQKQNSDLDFFSSIDGEKFNLKLPTAVDEYYAVKAKCEEQGWEPGQAPAGPAAAQTGPHRVLAQALMKRCIADIPLVQHVQKESNGMNKLYSQSMCSVKQWKAYQAAEAMVSAEVDEVRAEADEIEPGWSQVIWRQAMQYHQMLKQRHEMEAKQMAQQAATKRMEEAKVSAERKKIEDEKARIKAAEVAAQELLKAEEREKSSKKAFKSGNGMKKGFLASGGKKK